MFELSSHTLLYVILTTLSSLKLDDADRPRRGRRCTSRAGRGRPWAAQRIVTSITTSSITTGITITITTCLTLLV